MKTNRIILISSLVLLSLLLIWKSFQPAPSVVQPTPQPIPIVSPSPKPLVKMGESRLYPNPSLTPGDVFPEVSASDICIKGYSATVRHVTTTTKKQVFLEYDVPYPQPEGSIEVDHFISLELGGSNDVKNLWPEPADPKPGFHEKDKVENYLHQQICKGLMTLQEAQKEISSDWYAVYQKIQN